MPDLQIEDLLQGAAREGNSTQKVGSQFGSQWGLDGLMAREASEAEYAAFGASWNMKLAHGRSVSWLGYAWSSILTYNMDKFDQINIHTTDSTDAVFNDVLKRLQTILGEGKEINLPQDALQSVRRRFAWSVRSNVVSLVRTYTYIQVSIGPATGTNISAGCLGMLLVISSGLSLVGWFV